MVRAMTQAERVLDGIRESEKDGSQSVQRRALAKEIFGESQYYLDAILAGIRSIQADTSLKQIKKLIGGETVAKSSHGLVAEYVTQMEELWRF